MTPHTLRDSARALAFGLSNAQRFGGDQERVFVMGHSAGAYNAAMLALAAPWLTEAGHSPAELAKRLAADRPCLGRGATQLHRRAGRRQPGRRVRRRAPQLPLWRVSADKKT